MIKPFKLFEKKIFFLGREAKKLAKHTSLFFKLARKCS
jgi:hypothetical protein